jgi:hypothetical protein
MNRQLGCAVFATPAAPDAGAAGGAHTGGDGSFIT